MIKKFFVIVSVFVFIASSCDTTGDNIPKINLSKVLSSELSDNTTESLFALASSIELVMDEPDNLVYIGKIDTCIYAYSRRTIYIFNESGRLFRRIDNQGRGPQEYLRISHAVLDYFSKEIVVIDLQNKIQVYSRTGDFIQEYTNELARNTVMVSPYSESEWIISTYPRQNKRCLCQVVNRDFCIVNEFLPITVPEAQNVFSEVTRTQSMISSVPGNFLIQPLYKDTVYRINDSFELSRELIFTEGVLKPTIKAFNSINSEEEQNKYIFVQSYFIVGNYFLVEFYYSEALYYTVFKINTGELLMKHVVTLDMVEEGAELGYPFYRDGEPIFIYPQVSFDNSIYCMIPHEDSYNYTLIEWQILKRNS